MHNHVEIKAKGILGKKLKVKNVDINGHKPRNQGCFRTQSTHMLAPNRSKRLNKEGKFSVMIVRS